MVPHNVSPYMMLATGRVRTVAIDDPAYALLLRPDSLNDRSVDPTLPDTVRHAPGS